MRSLLFVPADSEKKIEKALLSAADCIILDLEDSVSLANKPKAREIAASFLKSNPQANIYVRVNDLQTGLTDDDLAAVIAFKPKGIMLPKSESGKDVTHLDAKITVLEAIQGLNEGAIKILPVATETAESIFGLNSYNKSSKRLAALTWGAEDLSADIGAETNRGLDGRHTEPFRLARSLLLFAANAAKVEPIDTVFPAFKDEAGLRLECLEARRDGFTGKMAIHPAQIAIINEVFQPSLEKIKKSREIIKAFSDNPELGVIAINGEMVDKPHLVRAERLLRRIL